MLVTLKEEKRIFPPFFGAGHLGKSLSESHKVGYGPGEGMQNSATPSFPRRLELTTNEIVQDAVTTIPRSLFYLTCSALIVTFILLLVSLLDLGYCSLWLTPPLCVLTLIYFIGVLIVSRMQRTVEKPTYFPTVVFVGYIMTSLWLIASILTIVVFAVYPHMVDALKQQGLHSVTVGLQRFECFLCLVDFGIIGGFTLRSHVIAMEEGDPENWRVLVEKNETPNPAASRVSNIFIVFHNLRFSQLFSSKYGDIVQVKSLYLSLTFSNLLSSQSKRSSCG